jgi:hypothetical protein
MVLCGGKRLFLPATRRAAESLLVGTVPMSPIHPGGVLLDVWVACGRLWLQDDFNAAILFMFKDLVSVWSLIEAKSMSDDKRGINLTMFNAL